MTVNTIRSGDTRAHTCPSVRITCDSFDVWYREAVRWCLKPGTYIDRRIHGKPSLVFVVDGEFSVVVDGITNCSFSVNAQPLAMRAYSTRAAQQGWFSRDTKYFLPQNGAAGYSTQFLTPYYAIYINRCSISP